MSQTNQQPDEVPQGVKLRDWDDFKGQREDIFNGVQEQMGRAFPQSYGGVRMEVHDLHYADPADPTPAEEKHALLHDKFLARRLRGTIKLFSEADNKPLDSRELTLLRVPYLTNRGTIIHKGSEYSAIMQARLKPGIYTRKQENGELETHVNVRPGTGNSFRVGFEPATTQYRLRVQQADLHLYSLLHDLGIPDDHLENSWGKDILDANRRKYDSRVFDKAYLRLVPKRQQSELHTKEDKAKAIKDALDSSKVDGHVVRQTLPNYFDMAKAASWRAQWAGLEALEVLEKQADSRVPFEPDYTPKELREIYNNLSDDPDVVGNHHWALHAQKPEANEAWLTWYSQYHEGKRGAGDADQIGKWQRMKRMHGAQLRTLPSVRRAQMLQLWAIDPFKLLGAAEAEDLRKKMEPEEEKAASAQDLGGLPVIPPPPLGLYMLEKCARYGAGVLFKQPDGSYLLEENYDDGKIDKDLVGKLRPAGGGKSKRDANLRQTILREMEEEFGLDPEESAEKIKLLGYIKTGPYENCAVFEMEDHGLKPGTYHASNSKTEKVKLVEAKLDDPRYIGAKPKELRRYAVAGYRSKSASEEPRAVRVSLDELINWKTNHHQEILPGGHGDGEPDSAVSSKEMATGMPDEREHTPSVPIRKEIIKDHIAEDPHYYEHDAIMKELYRRRFGVEPDEDPKAETLSKSAEARDIVKKTRTVEEHFHACPHCGHEFQEKGGPWMKQQGDEDTGAPDVWECGQCKGEIVYPEMTDDELDKVTPWLAEFMRNRREKTRGWKAQQEKSAQALSPELEAKLAELSPQRRDAYETFLATLGMGPKYTPEPEKTHECPECKGTNAVWREAGADTSNNRMELRCPDCGHPKEASDRQDFQKLVNAAVNAGMIPADLGFYVAFDPKKILVDVGDWHSKEEAKAAMKLARDFCDDVEEGDECGRPAWADAYITGKLKGESRYKSMRVRREGLLCPACGRSPHSVKVQGDALCCGECDKTTDMEKWEKAAECIEEGLSEKSAGLLSKPKAIQEAILAGNYGLLRSMAQRASAARASAKPATFLESLQRFMPAHLKQQDVQHFLSGFDKDATTEPSDHPDYLCGQLLKAKQYSDDGDYSSKAALMATLLMNNPEQFIVDNHAGKYWGITHVPTGFRMHVPRSIVPAAVDLNPLTQVEEEPVAEKAANTYQPWIGVDLDKTLAFMPHKMHGIPFIGKPIPAMKKRVLAWIAEGTTVKIFTARAAGDKDTTYIQDYLEENGMPRLEITNEKDPGCTAIWDDRAVSVEPNTGRVIKAAAAKETEAELRTRLGDASHHHLRIYCETCGHTSTCRCSAPKTEHTVSKCTGCEYNEKHPDEPLPWGKKKASTTNSVEIGSKLVVASAGKGCLMADFPAGATKEIQAWAAKRIPEADRVPTDYGSSTEDGLEKHTHVTVLYGFEASQDVQAVLDQFKGVTNLDVELGAIKRFKANPNRPESDCLVVEVSSKDLSKFNGKLRKKFSVVNNYPDYKPHVTLAYVRPGSLPWLDGQVAFKGKTFRLTSLVYSCDGEKTKHQL